MILKSIIVDDDPISIEILSNYIRIADEISLEKTFTDPVEAIKYLKLNLIDILFVDIHMPFITGIQLIKSLEYSPFIIVTSSSKQYAAEAFDYEVVDYLIKPFEYDRFLKACNKVIKRDKKSLVPNDKDIFIKVNNQIVKISKEQITFIEASGDYIILHTFDNSYISSVPMKTILDKLQSNNFMRIHRSYIVALDKIQKIKDNEVIFEKVKIPISNSYKDELYSRLNIIS